MKTPPWTLLTSVVAAAVMAAAASMPALAQTATHDHSAAAPHKLTLNQGRKWATDAPLRAGMGRIRSLVEPQLGAAHAAKARPALGLMKVAQAVNQYGRYFEDPGFKPIRNLH